MTATDQRVAISEPGVYDLPADEYHADPVPGGSLSSSGARKLLPPSCPALFAYERENPPPPKAVFDIGHAAHQLALGVGPEIVPVEADSWRTNAAKDAAAEARDRGAVPLLRHECDELQQMAAALRAHPVASALFDPEHGKGEASLFYKDAKTDTWLRAMLDWLPAPRDGRMIVPDYKTARSAQPQQFARSAGEYGYYMQAAWYADAVTALGLADDVAFVFVVQEKNPPYLVSIVELDVVATRIGRVRNRAAIDLYAECTANGRWPGYSDDVELVSLPVWVERQYEDLLT